MKNNKTLSKTLQAHASTIDTTGFEADYNRHLAEAQALRPENVRVMRIEPALAFGNSSVGASLVLDHASELEKPFPGISPDAIRTLPSYASAIQWANGIIRRFEPTPTEVKALLSRGRPLRKLMLAAAVMLSLTGTVSAATVAKINKGRGPRDTAQDLVDLSLLLGGVPAAVAAKTALTPADIANARAIGEQLLSTLKARRAKRAVSKEHIAAIDIRDRLWTLFEQTWERHVWLAGACLYGRAVDSYIPTLGVRMSKRAQSQLPPPAPVPPPVAPSPAPTTPPVSTTSSSISASGATPALAARTK